MCKSANPMKYANESTTRGVARARICPSNSVQCEFIVHLAAVNKYFAHVRRIASKLYLCYLALKNNEKLHLLVPNMKCELYGS